MAEPRTDASRIKASDVARIREELRKKQRDRCPLCGCKLSENLPSLDHDHTTGAIRGVLCRNCNQVEGRIKRWAQRGCRRQGVVWYLERLLKYLRKHNTDQTGLVHHTHGKPKPRRRRKRKP